jgi:hypothetical protein
MFCRLCGKENPAESKFCNGCGAASGSGSALETQTRGKNKTSKKWLVAVAGVGVVLAAFVAFVSVTQGNNGEGYTSNADSGQPADANNSGVDQCSSGQGSTSNADGQQNCNQAEVELVGAGFVEGIDSYGELRSEPCTASSCWLAFEFTNTLNSPVQYVGHLCAVVDGADYQAAEAFGQNTNSFTIGNLNPRESHVINATWYDLPRGSIISEVYLGVACDSTSNGYKYVQSFGEVTVK